MTWIEKYNEINRSFDKKLLYQLGTNVGFFSQYNNMVLMMYYCLKNRIRFVLSSRSSNITIEKGWQDYFEPFCEEADFMGGATYNPREAFFPTKKKMLGKILFDINFKLHGYDYHTYDLFKTMQKMDVNEYFSCPELGLDGNLVENCRRISNEVWRLNKNTRNYLEKNLSKLSIGVPYSAVHIRRGDKNIEISDTPILKYMQRLKQETTISRVYVATDDYRVYDYLRNKYPDYEFYTNVRETKNGYFQDVFDKLPAKVRYTETLALLTDVELLSRSECCVGTYSSNVGMFLYWQMPTGHFVGVDYDNWKIWK